MSEEPRSALQHSPPAADGGPVKRVSMLMGIPSPDVAALAIGAGYDSVILDCEHGFPMGSVLRSMISGVHDAEGRCFVRIPRHASDEVGALADIGVDGIVLSNPEAVGDMASVGRHATFGSSGSRSVNPFVPAAGTPGDLVRLHASARSLDLWAMAENSRFLDALEDLRDDDSSGAPPWSGVIIGPYDLAADLGCDPDPHDPLLRGAAARYVEVARALNLELGLFVRDGGVFEQWRALDVDPGLVVMGYDRDVWFQECERRVLEIKGPERAQ